MSKDIIKKLTLEINKHESLEDKELKIIKFQLLRKSMILKVVLRGKEKLTHEEEELIKKIICKTLMIRITVEIVFYRDASDISLEEVIENHWIECISSTIKNTPLCKSLLLNCKRKIKDNKVIIYNGYDKLTEHLKGKNGEKSLEDTVKTVFGISCRFELKFEPEMEVTIDFEARKKEEKELLSKAMKARAQEVTKSVTGNKSIEKRQAEKKPYEKRENIYKREQKAENAIYGRNISIEETPINEINERSGYVAVLGEVFKVDTMETKTGKIILTFYITDYTSSITVKCFLKPQEKDEVLENVKKGLYCKVRGEAIYDTYQREVVIMGRDILKMKKVEKVDSVDEKRVELHCHTTMSTMDGVTPVSKIVERAAKWGHPAIAITDHGGVQAFPDAQIAAKKNKIKVLYGVEGYLVDDGVPLALNEKGQNLNDTYVVFDLETTGFSSKNDKIIEIGAVKIKNGEIIGNFSEFVNPKRPIPYKIIELTGINDDMVRNAETIEEILPKFLEFIGDSVVVAHNASFDCSFISKNCNDLGLTFEPTIVDTVPLCRFLYPELKSVKLNIVAKHLGVKLESHHRAVDDAKATGDILLECIKKTKEEMQIDTLAELNKIFLEKVDIKKLPTYHIIILAKTQAGIRNIYKLVSEAHIDNFFRRPRTKKSRLMEMREGLIIGGACEAGEIYRAIIGGKSDEEVKDIMRFYDYAEIQPIGNNAYMIEKGSVKDEDELKDINRKIYNLAKEINKPTVATCDVHFLDPHDEAFRRIIMAGQGFGDADNQAPLYLRTTEEMLKEFAYLGEEIAREVVIKNPNYIANSIDDNLKPIPDETYPPKIEGADDDIRNMTMNKVHSIYGNPLPEVVQKRLDKELNSIINNGYAVLYLIAQKLVAKSYSDGYLVGSRGSVGSSFVATMSDITEVNGLPPHYVCPKCKKSHFFLDGSVSSGADLEDKDCPDCGVPYIKDGHDIPFETFLGFEGDKEPDIDLNFSGDNQGDIHKYTEVLFGKGYVFKAGTIGTVAEKTAYGFVKKYLDQKGLVVSQAEIERLTIGCTGIKRTTGQHPGGIMVVPNYTDVYNFTPIQRPADDSTSDVTTTHFDYHSISGRLLKLDILGHDDPTVLRMLQDITGLDPKTIPLNDKKVLSLFTSPEALGVTKAELECEVGSYGLPEFGTKFVRGMLLDTLPKSFGDLLCISGLSHGTDVWLNNAQDLVVEGTAEFKEVITTRDDIMNYLIFKGLPPKMAFTIMESVRKGKGLKPEFIEEMKKNDVPDWYIGSCQKIKYMFPKAHAVAYVMMSFRLAYYKVHYPAAFYATYFTIKAEDFDADLIVKGLDAIKDKMEEINALGNDATAKEKNMLTVLEVAYEMYARNIKILPVDIYESDATLFKVIDDKTILPPMIALQGVGENAAIHIQQERENGEFISKEDLRKRTKISKTVIETLTNHGSLKNMSDKNQLSLF